MDDRPTPIVKLVEDLAYAQLLSNFIMDHPLEISVIDVTNLQSFMDNLTRCHFSTSTNIYHR